MAFHIRHFEFSRFFLDSEGESRSPNIPVNTPENSMLQDEDTTPQW
jgi:hypothetical protein